MKHSKRVAASDLSTGSLIPRTREGDQRAYDPATYDARNQRTETLDPLGNRTTYTYASTGEPLTVKDALGKVTTSIYDTLHRNIGSTDPLGHTTSLVLDAWGNAVATFDALLNAQNALFNELGQDVGALDSRGGYTRKVLGLGGELLQLVDPVGNAWDWRYDGLGRETLRTDPLGASTTTTYDADNRMTSVVDRLGRAIEYTYDDEDRLTKEVWKSNAGVTLNIVTHTYDDNSNRTKIQDNAGTITYTYDALDRVESYRNVFGQALTYTYDSDSNVTQRADSLGGYLTSTYDAESRLSTRKYKNGSDEALVSMGYSARGELATLTRYSDIAGSSLVGTTTYARDDAMRLTGITNKDAANATLSYYNYAHDNADRVTTHTYSSAIGTVVYSGTNTYTYDSTSQLTGDTGTPYSHDANGNRTMAGYATGTANQMTNDGTWTYTYDTEGNLSTKSKGSGLEKWYFTWDNRNHLTNVRKTSDGTTTTLSVTYTYDGEGARVQEEKWKTGMGTVTTRFGNDGDQIWAYLDGGNVVQTLTVYGEGTDEILARIVPGTGVYAAFTDHQGSVRDEHKFGTGLVNHIDYDAFGNATESNPSLGSSVLYAGGDADRDTGLTRFGERYYASNTGRWQSPDPIMFGGGDPNLYRYVGNNATNATDPTGLLEKKAFWVNKANEAIAGYKKQLPAGAGPIDEAIIRNRFITAAYAKLYLRKPNLFPWMGLAAIASNEVGNAMRQCRSEIKIEEDTASIWDFQGAVIVRQKLIAVADSTAQLLGKGNIAVFNDLYWQFLAYEDGGIKQMKALHADKELSAAMLKNWMTLDADPWKGNLAMFRREQQDILQPLAFDRMNSYVAQKATEAAFSLFPGATAFNKLKGKSIAVFDDRWTSWITPKLWPEWKKFSESVPAKKYLSFIMKELSNPLR